MSTPIPEWARKAAQEAYDRYANGEGGDVRDCIARALMAEREACAKIARDYPFTEVFELHKNGAVACNASQNIADMIEGRFASAIRDRSKT